jgi:hypothetical protein
MMRYYAEKGDTPEFYQWLEKGMDMGYAGAIGELASLYAGQPGAMTEVTTEIKRDYRINKAKSYACFYIISKSYEPNFFFPKRMNKILQQYKKSGVYSAADIKQGEKIGQEWLKTHKFIVSIFLWGVTS